MILDRSLLLAVLAAFGLAGSPVFADEGAANEPAAQKPAAAEQPAGEGAGPAPDAAKADTAPDAAEADPAPDAAEADPAPDAAEGETATDAKEPPTAEGTDQPAATETAEPTDGAEGTDDQAAGADGPGYVLGDVAIGDPNAPVTMIEYASLTCPHCATFHTETWPEIKKNYVDTGKVRFILREVYFDEFGLWASMVARCGGEAAFYPLIDAYLKRQASWTRSADIVKEIVQIGRRAGLSSEQIDTCLSDRDYAKALVQWYLDNAKTDEVRSTPTFIIGDERINGAQGYEAFEKVLDAALGG